MIELSGSGSARMASTIAWSGREASAPNTGVQRTSSRRLAAADAESLGGTSLTAANFRDLLR